jgi:hypothetical protein
LKTKFTRLELDLENQSIFSYRFIPAVPRVVPKLRSHAELASLLKFVEFRQTQAQLSTAGPKRALRES